MTYSSTTNRLNSVGTQVVQYDAAGNLLNTGSGSGTYSYTWDAEGRMATVGSPAGTTVATYMYNALGQRVERSGSGVPSSPLYEVYDAFGNLALVTSNSTMEESLIGLGGRMFAKYTPSGTFFLHADALGATFYATDWTGKNWPQAALYDPWGQRWVMWTGGYGTIDDRYAGMQERDSESWLDPTPNRMYASSYGRWFTPDPLGGDVTNPQSLNRYAYVLNNPMTLTDPTGLNPCPTIGPGGSYACTPEQAAQSNVSGPAGSIYNGIAGANPFSLLYLMTSLMAEGSEPVLVNFGAWDLISPVFILVPDVKNDCQGPFARQRNYTLYQLQGGSLQPASNNYVWEVLQSQTNSGLSARLFGGGWTTQNLTNGATQGGFPDRVSIGTGAPATRIQNFMVSNVNPNTGNGQIWPASVALNNGNLVPAQTIVRASGQILIGGTAPKFFATSCGSLGD